MFWIAVWLTVLTAVEIGSVVMLERHRNGFGMLIGHINDLDKRIKELESQKKR
jgi:hypothetical protein